MKYSKLLQEVSARMAISTYTTSQGRKIDDKFLSFISKAGFRYIELGDKPEQFDMANPQEMKKIQDMCSKAGLSIISYHVGKITLSGLESERARIKVVDTCKRQIETLQECGGTIWASHTRKCDTSALKSHQELARYVEGTDVKIALENFVEKGAWVRDRMEFLNEIDHPHVGLLLDIGHVNNGAGKFLFTIPGESMKILQLCKDKLFHVHLHGIKKGTDHYPPLFQGDEILWKELFASLWDVGYNGYYLFEPGANRMLVYALELTSTMPFSIAQMMGQTERESL